METLLVDAEGKITIPSEVLQKRGLRPERDALWNESAETLEADAEDDERELPASQRPLPCRKADICGVGHDACAS
jgi:hypothetical protein